MDPPVCVRITSGAWSPAGTFLQHSPPRSTGRDAPSMFCHIRFLPNFGPQGHFTLAGLQDIGTPGFVHSAIPTCTFQVVIRFRLAQHRPPELWSTWKRSVKSPCSDRAHRRLAPPPNRGINGLAPALARETGQVRVRSRPAQAGCSPALRGSSREESASSDGTSDCRRLARCRVRGPRAMPAPAPADDPCMRMALNSPRPVDRDRKQSDNL